MNGLQGVNTRFCKCEQQETNNHLKSPFVAFSQARSTKADKDSLKRLARARVIGPMGSSRESHLMLARGRRSDLEKKSILTLRLMAREGDPVWGVHHRSARKYSGYSNRTGYGNPAMRSVNPVTHILAIEVIRRERFTYLDDGVPVGTLVHPMKTKDNNCETDGAIVCPFQAATNLYVIHP
ncbi:hypothetical protein Golax_021383, partial [Gossypium laxum]|nr:hypothetical protein [Gossypium laxum]